MVQAAAPLDSWQRSPDARQLRRLIGQLRVRFGIERATTWALRGVAGGGFVFIAISIVNWLTGQSMEYAWAGLPLAVALAAAIAQWPSGIQAAREGDRRLRLEERLATAAELAQRHRSGRFDALQLRDAVSAGQRIGPGLVRLARREAAVATILVALAAVSLAVRDLPRPSLPGPSEQQFTMLPVAADDAQARVEPVDLAELTQQSSAQAAVQQVQPDPDLAGRVELERAEREALDRLSQALGKVSAAQPAADAIERGDFAGARDLLSQLAEEADQLSDAAKQQLARSLQQAASATTTTDRALADRERQAASALSRSNYNEQRQALRNLGDQVEKSGARSASSDQLARDVGRLQQQTGSSKPQGQAGQAQSSSVVDGPTAPASAGQAPAGDGSAITPGTSGQQGGPGIGAGPGGDAPGDAANRLDAVGQTVQVPQKLGAGPGVRPLDGTEDQLGNDPMASNRAVSELVQAQQTGQVTPEQNLVPGEQRPLVRGYFH